METSTRGDAFVAEPNANPALAAPLPSHANATAKAYVRVDSKAFETFVKTFPEKTYADGGFEYGSCFKHPLQT